MEEAEIGPERAPALKEVLIEVSPGPLAGDFAGLWAFRELAFFLLARELKAGHRQMALGPLWIVVGPMASMLIYTLIFSVVADLPSDDLPYPLFNFAALVPWTFFAVATTRASESLVTYKSLIKKAHFPRLALPLLGVLGAVVDLVASLLVLFLLMAAYGRAPGLAVLAVVPFLLLAGASALALGLWTASWVARYRDTSKLISYLLAGWIYACPVVYATSVVPEAWQPLYRLNPLTVVVEGTRWALLGTNPPVGVAPWLSVVLVVLALTAGLFRFRRAERTIVDVI
jgi:lipopolysaccharide transport system permease protein